MKNADKTRDPERARKRAKSDARCALRKLGLLELLEEFDRGMKECLVHDERATLAMELAIGLQRELLA